MCPLSARSSRHQDQHPCHHQASSVHCPLRITGWDTLLFWQAAVQKTLFLNSGNQKIKIKRSENNRFDFLALMKCIRLDSDIKCNFRKFFLFFVLLSH